MRKKLLPKIGFVVLSLVFVLSTCMVVMASATTKTQTQDGLEATLVLDKDEYSKNENVLVTLNVKNNNVYSVKNVQTEIILPNEMKVVSGSLTQEKFTLDSGSTKSQEVTVTKHVEETVQESPKTGDNSHIGIYIALMVISGTGLVVLTLRKKKLNKVMSLVLCFALLGTVLCVPVVNAEPLAKNFTVESIIKYANEDIVIKANISYAYVKHSNATVTNGTGTGLYAEGDTVSITADEKEGQHFTSWTVVSGNVTLDNANNSTTTFVMGNKDVEIKAEYAQNTYTIEVTSGENGKVSPAGEVTVNHGENQTFTITANEGYHIVCFEIDGNKHQNPEGDAWKKHTVELNNVKKNYKLSATFAIDTFEITATAGANGTITESADVNYGGSKTFTITPNANYHIKSIVVDGTPLTNVTNTYTFENVKEAHTIEVEFAIDTFTIEVTSGENGKVSPAGNVSVEYGKGQTFTITPNTGYHIENVEVDGASKGKVNSYTFTNVKENHTIKATFAIDTFKITATAGANGTITETATVDYGDNKTFTITPNTGYHIEDVKVDDISVGKVSSYEFKDVKETHKIEATFAIDTFTITSSAEYGGGITESATVNYGDNKTFTFTPNADYAVFEVIVDGESKGAISSYTFTNVKEEHSIKVSFAKVVTLSSEDDVYRMALYFDGDVALKFAPTVDNETKQRIIRTIGRDFNSNRGVNLVLYDFETIPENLFYNCNWLKKLVISSDTVTISERAFYMCGRLETVVIPSSVQFIGNSAFSFCDNLKNVVILSGVKTIGSGVFGDCGELENVTIPSSVTSIGDNPFIACRSLVSIKVDEGNSVYHSSGNCLIHTSNKELISGCTKSVIPTDGSVTFIGGYAFYNIPISDISIPEGITSIGTSAFEYSSLKTVKLPKGLKYIGNTAFESCYELTSVVIPNSVISIGSEAFRLSNNIKDIYYTGTEEEWNNISKGSLWDYSTNFTVHYNYSEN